MKLNKTLLTAALIAGGIFAADFAVRAQSSTNPPPPVGARPPGGPGAVSRGGNFETVATQLALTDDQKTKARPVFQDMMKQLADLRNDTTAQTPVDRRAKVKAIHDAANTKLKDIFTPEQLDKWQRMTSPVRRAPGTGAPPPVAPAPPAAPATPPQ